MDHVLGLECTICGAQYGVGEVEYVCPEHGNDGILDVRYDYGRVATRISPETLRSSGIRSIWRYLPLLPVEPRIVEPLVDHSLLASVGWTPLFPAPRLAAQLGLRHLWIKDDGRQPTASLKDRASAVAVVKARERGDRIITTASTGNAAAALAGLCAAVSQRSVIFVPLSAPEAKIAQLLVYGASVLLVDGSYDDAFELCLEAAPAFGWYSRNTAYNPYVGEGKKTVAYEICEQLTSLLPGEWPTGNRVDDAPMQAPDRVFIPVGDGCIIGSVYRGFRDLMALGWIDHMPRLVGVQAAGSSPLVDAWERCREGQVDPLQAALKMKPVEVHTLADSISAGLPRDRIKALRAVIESDGRFVSVSDEEILAAIPALGRGCGVFAEPAAAAAYAGLVLTVGRGLVDCDERIVVLVTGSGLKDVAAANKSVMPPVIISPDLEDVRRAVEST